MNATLIFYRCLFNKCKPSFFTCNKIHSSPVVNEFKRATQYGNNTEIESSLWFTTLPRKAKHPPGGKKRRVVPKAKFKGTTVLISCKNKKLNHYKNQTYSKLEVLPLASKGWCHRKAAGDYFTILPSTEHPAFLATKLESQTLSTTFEDLGIKPELLERLKELNIEYPTTIQAKAIPHMLQGQNTIVAAETGCGKTLAYLLPMVQRILDWKKLINPVPNSPLGLIVLPTRELALQVGMFTQMLCQDLGINMTVCLGGRGRQLMLNTKLENVDIAIATLGVICKLTANRLFLTRMCKYVVIDEADTLMDDSFHEKLVTLLRRLFISYESTPKENELPKGAQICFASATMPRHIPEKLSEVVMVDSLLKISTEYLHKIQPHLTQKFIRIAKSKKPEELLKLVRKDLAENRPVMIFSNKSATSNFIYLFLNENGIKCIKANGAMGREERLSAFQEFRLGYFNVISCTDLTSRGLDTTKVKHIINYDFPGYMADYVHRCGRTGRLNHDQNCLVTNFVSRRRDVELLQKIERAARLQQELPDVNNNITRIISKRMAAREENGSL